ncbi:ribonuclease P [Streptococcus sanguinis]|uniref:ribonuclease P n=1 Tax=Streptococcus sanguinis TaxID=1305 RepID=UPI001CC1381A|nr:ribonuclease P [Streptococcus sanguinis]MBZ2020918.1 ribonuclease P [Streptococcus sanguinis]MBZ2073267.1 ribonuclease P [Streptococcus sanguinis]MBZ2081962.1 ribonuclease P [Streptococcus sanguinis]MCC3166814.1 response regulator [Streptococcus sanguinis]
MSLFPAIESYLPHQGAKYMSPDKAGQLRESMLELRAKGQAARKEFADLVKDFQRLYPKLTLERTSQWMNQAQILRPHFWNYLKGYGEITEPMFALRLYGTAEDFGVSLEVSFMERKKDEHSLSKQNRVLNLPIQSPAYYFAQIDGVSQRFEGTEENRQLLTQQLAVGQVRKVLIKYDIPLSQAASREQVLSQLQEAMTALIPFYEATRTI